MLPFALLLGAPTVDPRAMAVLTAAESRLRQIRTLSTTYTHTLLVDKSGSRRMMRQVMKVSLMRPNLARVDSSLEGGDKGKRTYTPQFSVYVADGKKVIRAHPFAKEADTWPQTSAEDTLKIATILNGFFDPGVSLRARLLQAIDSDSTAQLAYVGQDGSQGVPCDVVRITTRESGTTNKTTLNYWIDNRGLVRRMSFDSPSRRLHGADVLSDVKLDAPIPLSKFAYRIPAGFHPAEKMPESSGAIPTGADAPDFKVDGIDSKPVRLSDYRGRVVVLDFWATWCGNCIQGFPHLNTLMSETKDLVVLAVNVGDEKPVFRKWVAEHPEFGRIVFAYDPLGLDGNGVSKLYKGIGLPLTYVVGRDGKVVDSFSGRSPDTDEKISSVVRRTVAAGTGP